MREDGAADRGPTTGRAADDVVPDYLDIRSRILDAAAECVLAEGYSKRMHASIARRAGLSRPTLYKYIGDQQKIIEALWVREFTAILVELEPHFRTGGPFRLKFIDTIVYIIGYLDNHALLQKALRDDAQVTLPLLTTHSQFLLAQTHAALGPYVDRLAASDGIQINANAVTEWGFRIITSLIHTPGGSGPRDEAQLRSFLADLLSIAFIPELGSTREN